MTRRIGTILTAGAALLLVRGPAAAESTHNDVGELLIHNGQNAGKTRRGEDGRERAGRQYGAGAEHATLAQLANGDIMVFALSSYTDLPPGPPRDRHQLLCAHVKMDPAVGPRLQTVQLVTDLDGDRYRTAMHPSSLTIDGGKAVSVLYNYAPDDRARTYAQVFGPGCVPLSQMTEIMRKNNDDCRETNGQDDQVIVHAMAGYDDILATAGCNGNGSDDSWVVQYRVTKLEDGQYSIEKRYDVEIEPREERSRPTVIAPTPTDPEIAYVVWTAGNTQPPNRGVRAGAIYVGDDGPLGENADERLIWRQYIAEKEGEIYRTQIRMAGITNPDGSQTGRAIFAYQELVEGRRKDKGTATMLSGTLQFSPAGVEILSVQNDVFPTSDATHQTICATMWGRSGTEEFHALMINGSHNGNPTALSTMQAVKLDALTNTVVNKEKINLGVGIDNAWISNIYGNNPNTQGRNFVFCKGNLKNPGYGVTGGYKPDVMSFVALPATHRRVDPASPYGTEDKLALSLVLVPAVLAPATPEPPPQDPPQDPPGEEETPGETPEETPPDDNGTGPVNPGQPSLQGCGVAVGSSPFGTFALMGLALCLGALRRRPSSR
jgi:hypothetical protein